MASMDSDLKNRMSAEDYKLMCEIAAKHFKERKVEISDAINTPFPFFEILRDREFITNEMYKDSKASCENLSPVQRVVYDILSELEKKFDLSLLGILFSKVMINTCPDLKGILTSFRNAIQRKFSHQATVGDESAENRNTQLSNERGTGANPYPFLTWLFSDQSNYPGTAPPDNRLSECLSETEDINAVDTSTISDYNALETQQAIEQRAQEFEPVVTSSGDSVERRNREEPPKASTSALKRKPESGNLGKSPTAGKKPCKKVRSPEASSGFNAKEKRPEAGSSAVRSGADQEGFVDLGNKSALQESKKKKAGQQPGASTNFGAQILRVNCGEISGLLIRRKFERGATRKCIRTEDGNWLTPREFEVRGGNEKASNWKTSLTCGGKTLKQLMELGFIHPPPPTREIKKKEENSDKCKICQDGGKLFRCENCQSFFHGDCHLPPLDSKRNGWNCTLCKVESYSKCQKIYRTSEVLVKQMENKEKLKCEFLLLKVYHHLESNIFPHIPRGNYVTKASQYLGKLRKLDVIKKKLIKENYSKVQDFKEDMDKFFQDPRREKLHLNQEEFMKNFKEVFAILETE